MEGQQGGETEVTERAWQEAVWNNGVWLSLCAQKVRINEYLSGAKRFTSGVPIRKVHAPRGHTRVQVFCNYGSGRYAGHAVGKYTVICCYASFYILNKGGQFEGRKKSRKNSKSHS